MPELKRVVVVNGTSGSVAVGDDLQEALSLAVGEDVGGEPGEAGGQVRERCDEQVGGAAGARRPQHYAAAQEALPPATSAPTRSSSRRAQARWRRRRRSWRPGRHRPRPARRPPG